MNLYRYSKLESCSHLVGAFAFFVDEVVFDITALGDDRFGEAAGGEVVFLEHAEHVDGGDVEELGAGGEEEDTYLYGGRVGGGHD